MQFSKAISLKNKLRGFATTVSLIPSFSCCLIISSVWRSPPLNPDAKLT
ncbi:hypothetical protein JCM19232_2226 [Vibrio ishigakensis]|uniref:Uncharacterized protein n=1 Tax=Vibrio ishigakensis TaxID=1481914 RepID=A0A0B8PBS2_9VIBR|nr:hypothetical protein JCM19232_2226 [Vibrio ishigakensis]